MHLNAIKDLIVELGIGRNPTDAGDLPPVFIHQSPPLEGSIPTILIMDQFGGVPVNSELPDYYRTSPQIAITSNRLQTGQALADRIFKELKAFGLKKGDLMIKELRPKHMPMSYRKNEGKAYEFSINYFFVFVTT